LRSEVGFALDVAPDVVCTEGFREPVVDAVCFDALGVVSTGERLAFLFRFTLSLMLADVSTLGRYSEGFTVVGMVHCEASQTH
jgi:hypothetical protein